MPILYEIFFRLPTNRKPAPSIVAYLLWTLCINVLLGLLSSVAYGQSLQINKSVSKTTANPTDYIVYTIQYNCTSITTPCTNVVITDQIPAGLAIYSLITNAGTAINNGQDVTFDLGTLAAGTTGEVTIITVLDPKTPGGTVLPNSATITSGGGPPIVSNTVSTTVNTVLSVPALYKAAYTAHPSYIGNGQLVQGQTGIYELLIQNLGNVAYNNFCVVDTLPLPDKFQVNVIVPGAFIDAPATVRVEYQTNTNTTWTALSGSPFPTTGVAGVPVSLPAGQYVTMVRWCFDQAFGGGAHANSQNLPLIKFNIPANMPLVTTTNCMVSSSSNAVPGRSCISSSVVPPINGSILGITKNIDNAFPAVGDTVTFTVQLLNNTSAVQALKNGVIVDSFNPLNLAYVSNSWSYNSTYAATAPTFSTATGPDGATLLKWVLTGDVPAGQSITVTFKAIVKNGDGASLQQNAVQATGSNIQPNTCANGASSTVDYYDIDGDGNTTENVCYNAANFTIQSLALLKSEKSVKGQSDAIYSRYPAFGSTVPGGSADYRLKVYNAGSVPMKNAIIIDVLPFIGDKGVLDPQTRLSQWRPNLAGPVTPPTGITVYYSTQSNPCRPELNYNPAGCTNAAWATVPPADITQVQALKFDFGSIIINPNDSLFLTWPMRAPTTAPTNGEIAWNSFGYVATRTDNNTQLLPAEPIKVGIKVNPLVPAVYGDFVWLDTNQNGIQDAGELGVSGVRVELYKDNGDGIPNKATDALVGFTVTDASGNYLFSSLQPGDYFAIFYPPSGYAVSPSLVGSNKAIDSEGIIAAVTSLSATEVDLTWDLGIYPSTTCDVQITNATVSPCTYSGGVSRTTVNVFVTWANAPASQNITVSVAGAPNQIINVTGGATSPVLLTFTTASDGATHAITAGFNANCQDISSVLSPQPCAPAVCALGITNVLTGACTGTKRQINATVSWSNNPVSENIIVTWDGVPVDTILVTGGLGSPQPTRFYVTGDAATHTIAARFISTTACSALVSGISVPACVPSCGLNMVITPGLCASATNSYVLSGTITATNVPTSGTLTISSGAFANRTISLPAGNATGTFSYSGLVSNGQAYTVTAAYSNSACSPVSQTYTAPVSCSVAPICSLAATASAGLCNPANNSFTATVAVTLSNAPAGTITVTLPGALAPISQTIAANTTSFTAVFAGLISDGASHTATVSLPGCGTTTATFTAPVSCTVAPVCSISAVATPGICQIANNTYTNVVVVRLTNPTVGVLTVTDGPASLTFATTAVSSATFTATFNNLTANAASHTVTASLPACGTATTTYIAPVSCSVAPVCSLTATATPGSCDPATNTYSTTAVVQLTNPTAGTLTITDGAQSATFVTTAASSATFTTVFSSLIATGTSHTVTASLAGCSTTTTSYTAPTSCSIAPVCSISATVSAGPCAIIGNTYSATAVVTVANPSAGGTVTISTGAQTLTFSTTAASQNTFRATFNGLISDGVSHTVVSSLPGCSTVNTLYTAPASCSLVPPCSLSAVSTQGLCASATNTFSNTVLVTMTNPTAGILTVTDGASSITFVVPASIGTTTAMATFNGIISNGAVHTVTISLPGCGTATTTYTAPASCAVAPPCALSVVVTPGVCTSATNQYSVTGSVSAINATGSQVVTITDGVASTTVSLVGNGPASFTLTGLISNGAVHTLVASATACGQSSTTYTAPVPCVGCLPAKCLPLVIIRTR